MKNKTIVIHHRDCNSGDVYIGRPSKWGNPFEIGRDGTRSEVIAKYREYILNQPELLNSLDTLAGKRLVCWCKPKPCHGDVLVQLINGQSGFSLINEIDLIMLVSELYAKLGKPRVLGTYENGKLVTDEDIEWLVDVWNECHAWSKSEGQNAFMDYISIGYSTNAPLIALIAGLIKRVASI